MNAPAAPEPRREIVLAQEKPFRLAATQVRPASLEVEFQSQTASLEPRVMQVLVALSRRAGEPVSREMLIDCCWAGRVVTDGALNRAVAQLRKTLRDPDIRIETIPTVGYRLQAATVAMAAMPAGPPMLVTQPLEQRLEQPAEQAAARKDALAPPRARRPLALFLMVAAVLGVGAGVWQYATADRSVIWTASEFRPLTATAEQETFPALSPTGTQIVYAARPDGHGARDLYLRNVDEGTPIRLTSDWGDDYGAAWSPDGSRIAFVRSAPNQACALIVVPVPRGSERVVTHCEESAETRPSWLDASTLLFSDRTAAQPVPRIRAVNVETGALRDLTAPSPATLGDSDPQAAPDGRHIAFRRSLTIGADDLLVLDSRSGRETAMTTDGWKASAYVWSSDSRHIFFASNRGGDFGLWSTDRLVPASPRRVSLGLGTVSFLRMSADRQNRIAVEFTRGQNKLARMSESGRIEVLTAGAGSDGDPAVSGDGSLVHVSNRGGTYELWLLRNGAEPAHLTSLQGSYVLEPSWSRNGSRVVFVGVKGRSAQVYTVERDGAQLRQLTDGEAIKRDPVFTASGSRVQYLERADGKWRLMELDLQLAVPVPHAVPGGEGWTTLRAAPDGTIFGRHESGPFVRRVTPAEPGGSGVPLSDFGAQNLPRIEDIDSWTVGQQGIYVRRGSRIDQVSSIWFYPWLSPGRKLADAPLAYGNIAVDPAGNVVFSQGTTMEVDLAMMELRAQD